MADLTSSIRLKQISNQFFKQVNFSLVTILSCISMWPCKESWDFRGFSDIFVYKVTQVEVCLHVLYVIMIVVLQESGTSNENQRSPEDLLKIIKELESKHFVVQHDKMKVCSNYWVWYDTEGSLSYCTVPT